MGLLSKFEGKMEDTVEGAADRMGAAPLSPVQIAKKAEKQMRREKMVGAGKQYAPTLYTVLVNADDDRRLRAGERADGFARLELGRLVENEEVELLLPWL